MVAVLRHSNLLNRDLAVGPQVIQARVAGDPQDPRGERDLTLLVLGEGRRQLRENVLRDVLGRVVVANDAPDIGEDIGRVSDVKKVQGI